jgi:hypothetical protein
MLTRGLQRRRAALPVRSELVRFRTLACLMQEPPPGDGDLFSRQHRRCTRSLDSAEVDVHGPPLWLRPDAVAHVSSDYEHVISQAAPKGIASDRCPQARSSRSPHRTRVTNSMATGCHTSSGSYEVSHTGRSCPTGASCSAGSPALSRRYLMIENGTYSPL